MTDQEFLHAFDSGRLSRLSSTTATTCASPSCSERLGLEAASEAVAGGIRGFAAAHGHHRLYHETLTRFWVRIVAHVSQPTFEGTLERHPMLLRKDLPLSHWRQETLFSDAAREVWAEPDLAGLPFA